MFSHDTNKILLACCTCSRKKISFSPLKNKIHIFALPCNPLFITRSTFNIIIKKEYFRNNVACLKAVFTVFSIGNY